MQKLTITITNLGLIVDLQALLAIAINSSLPVNERFFLNSFGAWAHVCLN
jgi:hypothetical protein